MKIQNYRNSTLFDSYELAIKYIQTVLVEDKSILDGQEIYARYRNNDGNVVTIVAAAYKDKDGNLSFSILNDGLSIISSQDEPSEEFRDNYIWLQETEDSVVMEEDDVAIDIRSMQRAIMELMSIVQRHEYAFKNVMDCGTISNNLREEMMEVSADSVNRKYGELIEANESYNRIYLLPNPNYNPILYIKDVKGEKYIQNSKYDPRRYILNPQWDPYPKKWNKWITNGSDNFIQKVSGSTLYKTLLEQNVINNNLNELSGVSQNKMTQRDMVLMFGVDNSNNVKIDQTTQDKLNTRYYMFAPDIIRYCNSSIQDLNLQALFSRDEGSEYLKNGIYGVVPPFMFEIVPNVKNLQSCFKGVNILPYQFSEEIVKSVTGSTIEYEYKVGNLFNEDLFGNLSNLTILDSCFSRIHVPSSVQIPPNLFMKNTSLTTLKYLFSRVSWYGINSKLTEQNITTQIHANLFINNMNIDDVSGMFAYWNGSGEVDTDKRFKKIPSSSLFSQIYHKKLRNVSSLFEYSSLVVEYENDVIPFWKWSTIPPYFTNCYNGVNEVNGNIIPPAFK